MKLIKQSFEFINQTDFSLVGIKKQKRWQHETIHKRKIWAARID